MNVITTVTACVLCESSKHVTTVQGKEEHDGWNEYTKTKLRFTCSVICVYMNKANKAYSTLDGGKLAHLPQCPSMQDP